jgi:hypothetical protein
MRKYTVAAAVLALAGCTTDTGVMQVRPDTYEIQTHYAPVRGGITAAQKAAVTEAGEFCAAHGGQLYVLNENESGGGPVSFARWSQYGGSAGSGTQGPTRFSMVFRCQPPAAQQESKPRSASQLRS